MADHDILKIGDFPPAVEALLDSTFTTCRWADIEADAQALARIRGAVMRSNFRIEPAMIEALPNLGVIATSGVGYDGVPLALARARGIQVANTPNVLNATVAELTIGLLLSLLRGIPSADRYVRDGRWANAPFALGHNLAQRQVGFVGMGRIGQEIARKLQAFDVTIAYYSPADQRLPWRFEADLLGLATQSDILIVTAPSTPQTRGLVNGEVLAALGADGYLVNVARGPLVDEAALINALQRHTIAGAALDVFLNEPTINPAYLALDNVVLTPHMGSATHETRAVMAQLAIDNLRAFLDTGRVLTPV